MTALARLADCKAWLGLTSTGDDALLTGLIAAISQAIAADLGRTLSPAVVSETADGGVSSLPLREWPVSAVLACTVNGAAAPLSAGPGQAGLVLDPPLAAPPGRQQFLRWRGGWFAHGTANVIVTYRAGFEIVGEAATVPLQAPFTVAAQAPFGPWLVDTGTTGAPGPYTVADGTYTFPAAAAGLPVTLSYGYVPADISRAAIEWVADRYAGRSRIGQRSRSLGGQETASFALDAMPDIVDRLLQPYRRVTG